MGIVEAQPDIFYVCTIGDAAIERYDLSGWTPGEPVKRQRVFTFPTSASGLNGACLLAPGILLIADSTAGLIWRVDLGSGAQPASASVWLRDTSMAAGWELPQVVLTPHVTVPYPGVNGVRFAKRTNHLYFYELRPAALRPHRRRSADVAPRRRARDAGRRHPVRRRLLHR